MLASRIWTFLKENIISLATVILGVIVLVYQGLGDIPDNVILNTILALVALLATSEIVEKQRKLSNIEKSISEEKEALVNAIDNLMVEEMTVDELVEFMRYKTLTAKSSILWASPEPRRGTSPEAVRSYEEAIDKIVDDGKIQFSWISTMTGNARASRALRLLNKNLDKSKVFIGKVPELNNKYPHFSFIIFDEKVLTVRAPYSQGRKGKYLAIKSPTTVAMFVSYFNRLLEAVQRLESNEENKVYLSSIISKEK